MFSVAIKCWGNMLQGEDGGLGVRVTFEASETRDRLIVASLHELSGSLYFSIATRSFSLRCVYIFTFHLIID